jgi:hypothetical protein
MLWIVAPLWLGGSVHYDFFIVNVPAAGTPAACAIRLTHQTVIRGSERLALKRRCVVYEGRDELGHDAITRLSEERHGVKKSASFFFNREDLRSQNSKFIASWIRPINEGGQLVTCLRVQRAGILHPVLDCTEQQAVS